MRTAIQAPLLVLDIVGRFPDVSCRVSYFPSCCGAGFCGGVLVDRNISYARQGFLSLCFCVSSQMAPRRSKEALELERAAKRISDRAARVERIQTIWYGEILASRPVSCLPVPPLCYSPWSKRGWEYAYRTWRDAVIALGECDRLSESWTPTTTSNKTATCVIWRECRNRRSPSLMCERCCRWQGLVTAGWLASVGSARRSAAT